MSTEKKDNNESLETVMLIARVKDGDDEAFNKLYRLYSKPLKNLVRRELGTKLRGKMESMDVVQTVWKDVLPDLKKFQYKNQGCFLQWLSAKIVRKIIDKNRFWEADKRKIGRLKPLGGDESTPGEHLIPPAPDPTPIEEIERKEDVERLMGYLDHLTDDQRQALVLRMKEDKKFEDIGRIMGKKSDTVRKIYIRAVKRIGDLIHEEEKSKE